MRRTSGWRWLAAGVAASFLLIVMQAVAVNPVHAELAGGGREPLDRLLPNLKKFVAEHPEDPTGWFRLGRAHAIAFINNTTEVHHPIAMEPIKDRYPSKDATPLSMQDRRQHLADALKYFDKAIALDAANPLFFLSRGYLYEQAITQPVVLPPGVPPNPLEAEAAAKWEKTIQQLSDPDATVQTAAYKALEAEKGAVATVLLAHVDDENASIRMPARTLLGAIWREAAISDFWKAFELSLAKDMKKKTIGPMMLMDVASYQAGKLYLVLVKARPLSAVEKERIRQVEASVTHFNNLPQGAISPIVFSLTAAKPLAVLIDVDCSVSFDLDGDLVPEQRMWVQPDTAILCWDPGCEGKITSGRQLFGNVTWWIFWNNGYEALDALDDNRDGELTGAELTGLAVWRDANQNGVSDTGEVVPVVNVGIDSISVRAPETEDGCPANRRGLHLTDGRTLPTYDWYAPGVPASGAAAPAAVHTP